MKKKYIFSYSFVNHLFYYKSKIIILTCSYWGWINNLLSQELVVAGFGVEKPPVELDVPHVGVDGTDEGRGEPQVEERVLWRRVSICRTTSTVISFNCALSCKIDSIYSRTKSIQFKVPFKWNPLSIFPSLNGMERTLNYILN